MKTKRFKRIYIEISNVCNMRCSFCPVTKRATRFMSVSEFEHILIQIKPYTDYVYLHVKGEPLLHPDLGAILNLCEKYELKVNLTTNGTLLSKNIDILIGKKALRQVNISLHSFEGDSESDFANYLNGVMHATKMLNKSSSVIVAFRMWNQGCESKHKVMDRIYLNLDQKFEWPDINREIISTTGTCYGLRDQIGILADGTIVPCCLDHEGDVNLGNIFSQDFDTIISSKRTNCIIKGFRENKLTENLCMRCGYINKFR